MIYEHAHITLKPATDAQFQAAVKQALPIFQQARGCLGVELRQEVENPLHYVLVVQWATLEDHTQHFRQSPGYTQWRALVGEYFAQAPHVVHTRVITP